MNSFEAKKKHLWQAAIKWPLYSVAVMPMIIAAGWQINCGAAIRIGHLIIFLIASILILFWENLTNDLFDNETGVDQFKLHSVVALTGNKTLVTQVAFLSLAIGLSLISLLAVTSHIAVFILVLTSCFLGYLYQGPPFRLGYKGLGEPLCWLAFGPLATTAALLVISDKIDSLDYIPWRVGTMISAGPALATTLVLFCSHFHQVTQDAANGKFSPLVILGTQRAAKLIPWFIALILTLEIIPIINGEWPITALLCLVSLPTGIKLIKLLKRYHNQPSLIKNSKFLALRFQTINGLSLSVGFAISIFIQENFICI